MEKKYMLFLILFYMLQKLYIHDRRKYNMYGVLVLFMLVGWTQAECVKEGDGGCVECSYGFVIVDGECVKKQRGCLNYGKAGCLGCQYGYVWDEGVCVREAVYYNRTEPVIPPVVIDIVPTLTPAQIRDKIAEQFGSYASIAHDHILTHADLKGVMPTSAKQIKGKRNILIELVYPAAGGNHSGLLLIDHLQSCSVIRYDQSSAIEGIQGSLESLAAYRTDSVLYTIEHAEGVLVFAYLRGDKVFRISISLDGYSSTLKEVTLQVLALQESYEWFPYLENFELTDSVEKKLEQKIVFVLEFSQLYEVVVEWEEYQFTVNSPLRIHRPTSETGVLGGFFPFTELEDPQYAAVIQYVIEQFPELEGAEVLEVQGQVVAGMIFKIHFRTADACQMKIKVFHSLVGQIQLLDAQKDEQNVYTTQLQYSEDEEFLLSYEQMKNQAKIINIPGIKSVTRKILNNVIYYKVVFNQGYAEFTFERTTKTTTLQSYILDNEDILKLTQQVRIEKRSVQVLVTFIKNTNPKIMISPWIKSILYDTFLYTVTLVVHTGTYEAVVEDLGTLQLIWVKKLSQVNCLQLTPNHIVHNRIYSEIDTLLRKEFPLSSFNLQLIQIQVEKQGNKIQYLYASKSLHQIQIKLHQYLNKVTVLKAYLLNFGYGVLSDADEQYQIGVKFGKQLLGDDFEPFLSEGNFSHMRMYYENYESTYELVVDMEKKTGNAKLISTQEKLVAPSEMDINNLMTEEQIESDQYVKEVDRKAKENYAEYLTGGKIKFAEKTAASYGFMFNILYLNEGGYYKVNCRISEGMDRIKFNTLIISDYQSSDFSTCLQFNANRTDCLSCPEDQIAYQTSCFIPMTGCLIQPGSICVKCDADYILKNYKCERSCSAFLL